MTHFMIKGVYIHHILHRGVWIEHIVPTQSQRISTDTIIIVIQEKLFCLLIILNAKSTRTQYLNLLLNGLEFLLSHPQHSST